MADVSRAQHLDWCKRRALEYVELGELSNAVASMASDMRQHPETDSASLSFLAVAGMLEIANGPEAVRRWVEGFN